MTTTQIVVLVLVLLVVAAIAAALVAQSRKRKRLQSTFGPEYERTVQSSDKRRDAERELAEREQRRQSLDIRPLPAEDRRVFSERWRSTQADFVDQPEDAVRQADVLVTEVMRRRGYPVGDFQQMSRDVSVDHAGVVQEYRAAHEISELNDRHQASTEQLRQAMVHYRALFTDLLSDSDGDGVADSRTEHARPAHDGGTDHGRTDHGRTDADRVHVDRTDVDRRDLDRRDSERAHVDGTLTDGPRPVDRSDDVVYATDEDHARGADADHLSGDRTTGERATSDRAASDRTATEHVGTHRADTSRIDTSRADGVRVEPGGLDRNHLEDRDRPRG